MKATFDIPDDLYRSVKARSALEGRPLRAVAIELFQNWLRGSSDPTPSEPEPPTPEELTKFPWLAISQKYARPAVSSEMEDIRESIARGWAADEVEAPTSSPSSSNL
jgi:hypothetical protein